MGRMALMFSVLLLVFEAAMAHAAAPLRPVSASRLLEGVPDKVGEIGDALNVSVVGRWAEGPSQSVVVENGLMYHGRGPLLEILALDPNEFAYEPKGRLELPSLVCGLSLRDGLLYVANYWGGLRIIDVSDATHPVEIGSVPIDGTVWGVDVMDGLAVVPTSGQGVVLVDVTDPKAPVIVEYITGVRGPQAVRCVGHLAYLADRVAGFHIYDLSNPLNPVMLWRISAATSWDIEVQGTLVYLPVAGGLWIADASNPNYPEIIGRVTLPLGEGAKVAVTGGIAYVSGVYEGSCVVDVSDPRAPVLLSADPETGDTWDVAVSGSNVLVANGEYGLHLRDVADPTHPSRLGVRQTGGSCGGLMRDGSLAVVASGWGGLHVVDVGDETRPRTIAHRGAPNYVWQAAGTRARAVVSEGQSGVAVLDLTDPASPLENGRYDPSDNSQMLNADIQGDIAYVACGGGGGLQILDISDPAVPVVLGQVPNSKICVAAAVEGDVACVAGGDFTNGFLLVYDVRDPTLPTPLARLEIPGFAQDVAISDGYAYVVTYGTGFSNLRIFDIRTPASAHEVGRLALPQSGYGVEIAFPYVYVACYTAGLRVIDVSDRTAPVEVGHFIPGYIGGDVCVVGRTIYLSAAAEGFWILHNDLDPTPTAFANLDARRSDNGTAVRVTWETNVRMPVARYGLWRQVVDGARIEVGSINADDPGRYVMDDFAAPVDAVEYWIEVVEREGGSTWQGPLAVAAVVVDGIVLRGWPNPTLGEATFACTLKRPGPVTLDIFDARGLRVVRLHDGDLEAGSHTLTWNRCDDLGHRVAAGTYLARLRGRDFSRAMKVVVVD